MAGTDQRQELTNYIQSVHEEGVLDQHFDSVRNLASEDNPFFLVEIITVFCNDAENGIAELTRYLDESVVDYPKVTGFAHRLKGSSSSVGGNRMALACRELRHASEDEKEEECLEAFNKLKHEFNILRDKLNTICEMEKTILTNEGRWR